MEYEFLIRHRVKMNWVNDYYKQKFEHIGSVSKVVINKYNRETIYYIEEKGNTKWVCPDHHDIIEFQVEILDKYTKFTRFEIMEI